MLIAKTGSTFAEHTLTPDDHGAQALWHQQRERDMYDEKGHNQRHADEMHIAREVITAEHGRQPLKLDRLPNRKTRQHHHDPDDDDEHVQELLHLVIPR